MKLDAEQKSLLVAARKEQNDEVRVGLYCAFLKLRKRGVGAN
jgi:hypothetical protein